MEILEFLQQVKRVNSWDRTPAIDDKTLDSLIDQVNALLGGEEDDDVR